MKIFKKSMFLSLGIMMISSPYVLAKGAPELGDTRAFAHQFCGKNITIQIGNTTDNHAVLGLRNNNSGEIDLFVSATVFDINTSNFVPFNPVKFDHLSKTLVGIEKNDIDIVWGASQDKSKKNHYRLALGNYTYDCGNIILWPNDKANDVYGEVLSKGDDEINASPKM